MSLLNFSANLVAYADATKSANPAVKFTDLKWSMLGLPTDAPQMIPINLSPGETKTIMSLTRAISYSGGTTFTIAAVPGTSNVQLQGSYGVRTARTDGDGTTQWTLTRTNTLVQMLYTGTGTAPNFTSIQIGDGVTLGTGFSQFNQGDFVIVNKGSNFIEFVNAIGINETVLAQAQIYSNGPVQVGDTLDISNPNFSFPNQGQFVITRATDSFVEFSNPAAIPEVITGITSGVVIYPESSKWMLLAVDHKIVVQFNSDTTLGVEVEPPTDGDIANNPGLLIKRGKVFQLSLFNPGINLATGFVFLSG